MLFSNKIVNFLYQNQSHYLKIIMILSIFFHDSTLDFYYIILITFVFLSKYLTFFILLQFNNQCLLFSYSIYTLRSVENKKKVLNLK